MKRFLRLCSLLLTFAMILSLAAGAADTGTAGKNAAGSAPDFTPSASTQWNETPLSIPSAGSTLDATLTVPDTADPGAQVPMVILAHGLNTNQDWCSDLARYLTGQWFAEQLQE